MMPSLAIPLAGFLLLVLPTGGLCYGCAVTEKERPRVNSLLNKIISSEDTRTGLNPSILIALRLAGSHNCNVEESLLQRLSQDAVSHAKESYSSGKVALSIMAQLASCVNPRNVSSSGSTINLVRLLEQKYQDELQNLKKYQAPLTSFYQLSLDVLALCLAEGKFSTADAANLLQPDKDMKKYYLGQFSVDTAAVSILAQVCLKKMTLTPKVKKEIRKNVEQLVQTIMNHFHNGVLGNMYSTGLAMQALTVSGIQWNCRESLKMILDQIHKGTFDLPMAASQIIPSLEGQTYLNVIGLNCSADKDDIIPTPSPPTRPRLIHVRYTVSAKVKTFIKGTITVHVPRGSTFFDVMKVAMEKKCKIFRFTYENSSWGPYITSVQGLMADNNQRTYWQLLSGNIPLDRGAGNYIVSNKERLEVRYSKY
ncbi:transcobalamin-1-like isoform X1 [Alligator sinensis]|uniref:Transcobalamin-1-like isoform X1 n=1 Tax=Alligator sinensis TaxID=38654 RepID=A0A1U7S899_ALLSI|nr:transcobalamin-1-like isoform X1 [Alligator sinensis]